MRPILSISSFTVSFTLGRPRSFRGEGGRTREEDSFSVSGVGVVFCSVSSGGMRGRP